MDPATLSPDEVDAWLVRITDNWSTVRWRGHRLWQNLLDLNVISEHILSARPEVIVETGTFWGGSAIFFADMMRLAGVAPDVVSIDHAPLATPSYAGVHYLAGRSSIDPAVGAEVAALTGGRRVFVVLDSDHHAEHVYRELLLYAPLASVGDYLLVQDGNMHGALGLPSRTPRSAASCASWRTPRSGSTRRSRTSPSRRTSRAGCAGSRDTPAVTAGAQRGRFSTTASPRLSSSGTPPSAVHSRVTP